MHWLIHQGYLTCKEIRDTITIPHLIAGTIGYSIIHGTVHFRRTYKQLSHTFSTERERYLYMHSKSGHKGRYAKCTDCRSIEKGQQLLRSLQLR